MAQWSTIAAKALLRTTSQRLGQLQEKKDSQANITRRDIATLLGNGNIRLARTKALNLMQEDSSSDLLEILEMYVGIVLEHFVELDQSLPPSPSLVEAASSIIYASPNIDSKDLHHVCDILTQRLGIDFARSASSNRDHHVSSRVIRSLTPPQPSPDVVDSYLMRIAKLYSVNWVPDLRRQDIIDSLSEILDLETSPVVDLPRLRKLCSRGIPDEPIWLRPRIWKLFFGLLPVLKASWHSQIQQQRASYYELVRRLLEPLNSLPPPTIPLGNLDQRLQDVSHRLSRITTRLFKDLEQPPDISPSCPLDNAASNEIKIASASALDKRLQAIREARSNIGTKNESDRAPDIPEISLTEPESVSSLRQKAPTLLISPSLDLAGNAHPAHVSALLRLLFIHASINPGNLSPHVPSLLVPIYTVMRHEIETEEYAHAEADTFWLFEAIVGEFSELEDEEGGNIWMKKFGERVQWGDIELYESLQTKGLDPALPHYSYRWLAPLLTQTLPLDDVIVIWDAIFSYPMRERNTSEKLEFLLDVCTSMLIRARAVVFRLGKVGRKSVGLWAEEPGSIPPQSPIRAWELGDAFLEGMSILQDYPIKLSGSVDGVLQTASELSRKRIEGARALRDPSASIATRLRTTMWKGFTNQISSNNSPEDSEEESEEESEDGATEATDATAEPLVGKSDSITSRLASSVASSVWKGITNQSSMEAPPSPISPLASRPETPESSSQVTPASNSASPRFWEYAEKLKESDAAATLSKVSSNWRAKAMFSTWRQKSPPASINSDQLVDMGTRKSQSAPTSAVTEGGEDRRESSPDPRRSLPYSPPARPAFFRPPRDSIVPHQRVASLSSPPGSPEMKDGGLINRAQNLQASLASLTRAQPALSKSVPRPLLLNSSSLITTPRSRPPSLPDQTPVIARGHTRENSLAPSDAFRGNRSDRESDSSTTTSRRVPLNRRSVSPMAPRFHEARSESISSSGYSSDRAFFNPPTQPSPVVSPRSTTGWSRADADSPSQTSSPPPKTPITTHDPDIHINESEQQRGSVLINDSNVSPLEPPAHARKIVRKKTPPPSTYAESSEASDSTLEKSPRMRIRRQPRPANLKIHEYPAHDYPRAPENMLQVAGDEHEVITPKAATFEGEVRRRKISGELAERTRTGSSESHDRSRKLSNDGHERTRKISTGSRTRKISAESTGKQRRARESAAEEGDDEGYDDLLSAYESEGV